MGGESKRIVRVCTSLSTVRTRVLLDGITPEQFEEALDEGDIDFDFMELHSEVRLGDRVVGKVVEVDAPINEQFYGGEEPDENS